MVAAVGARGCIDGAKMHRGAQFLRLDCRRETRGPRVSTADKPRARLTMTGRDAPPHDPSAVRKETREGGRRAPQPGACVTESCSILVVDDELFVRELLLEFLGQNGFEVYVADRGARAIELATERHFDLCLLDLKMPEMNGLEVLNAFESLESAPLTIFMTGYPTVESAVACLRAGVFDYAIKPFKLPELLATVQKGIKEVRRRRREEDLSARVRYLEAEVSTYQAQRQMEKQPVESSIPVSPRPEPVARAAQQNSILALLERLGELRSKGVVEEGEYRQKKDELLARL
jgi:CheY-like chemotaxis protein